LTPSTRTAALRKLGSVVGIWAFLVFISLLTFGTLPRTSTGWLIAFLIGPLVLGLGEAAGSLVFGALRRIPGVEFAEHTAEGRGVSVQRILIMLAALIILLGVCYIVVQIAGMVFGEDSVDSVGGFLQRHFW
jgi:hypothetical protein